MSGFFCFSMVLSASAWGADARPAAEVTRAPAAVEGCPLSNPAYKDLRAAAAALEKKVHMDPQCQRVSDHLQASGTQINKAIKDLVDLGKPADAAKKGVLDQSQKNLTLAVNGLVDFGVVLNRYVGQNDVCGRALLNDSDLLVAMIDTVNALTPYVIAFGALDGAEVFNTPASLVLLSANIVGSAVKTFITFYNSRSYDMTKPEIRQAFIESACGYHQFNANLLSLLRTRHTEIARIENSLLQLEGAIAELQKNEVPAVAPRVEFRLAEEGIKQDRKILEEIDGFIATVGDSDGMSCFLVRTQIEQALQNGAFPASALRRYDTLVQVTLAESQDLARPSQTFLALYAQLQNPALYPQEQLTQCAHNLRRWVKLTGQLLNFTQKELAKPGRLDVSRSEASAARGRWEAQLSEKRASLEALQNRLNHLHRLGTSGEEIEVSELLDYRTSIRGTLFGELSESGFLNSLFPRTSPAEAWLEHKWRTTGLMLRDFSDRWRGIIEDRILKVRKDSQKADDPDLLRSCAIVEDAYMAWVSAQRHVQAARLFCNTFEQTLNEVSHPQVTEYCSAELGNGKISEREQEVADKESLAWKIHLWLEKMNCPAPKPISQL